jgi:alginate O-acetyltransferase complex protein AlgI
MLFHTLTFAIFFSIVVLAMKMARGHAMKKAVLLAASYVFYMWWNPIFVILIAISTLVDYFVGIALAGTKHPSHRKWLLAASVCTQIGFLCYFKYAGFLVSNLFLIARWLGLSAAPPLLNITLPVGISFYTFAALSYSIDVYRNEIPATRSLFDFSLFIIFFPHLVAGPIVRARQLLPQLEKEVWLRFNQETIFLFLRGLTKKVLVADNISSFADAIFANPAQWPSLIIWAATICFSIQIYCDFSGYSDMAIAIARVLGYDLPLNFRHPYFASNPSDFWRRWHITLSSWLRDYLYIPLGGNRKGPFRTHVNLLLTMVLGGLWHGTNWNFVLWGVWHGVLLIIHRAYSGVRSRIPFIDLVPVRIRKVLSIALMQYSVLISWILFRITDTQKMFEALRKFVLFDGHLSIVQFGAGSLGMMTSLMIVMVFFCVHFWSYTSDGLQHYFANARLQYAVFACVVLGILLFTFWPLSEAPFIYFQF